MALIYCDFFSDVLGLSTAMTVILPQATRAQIGMSGAVVADKHPTLYLLHGMSDDHTTWLRRTSIERYVAPLGLAVVMPAVHRSFYTDMAHGYRYWTFISEEVPSLARAFFPLSDARDANVVAPLSMGGYGAFKLALTHPQRYAAAASLSLVYWIWSAACTPSRMPNAWRSAVWSSGTCTRSRAVPTISFTWPGRSSRRAIPSHGCTSVAAWTTRSTTTMCGPEIICCRSGWS